MCLQNAWRLLAALAAGRAVGGVKAKPTAQTMNRPLLRCYHHEICDHRVASALCFCPHSPAHRFFRYQQDYISVTTGYCQILEIRKRVGNQIQIRGSMKRTDASKGEALVATLRPSGAFPEFHREQAVLIQAPIPLTKFGCEVTFKDGDAGALILQPIRSNQGQHQIQEFTIDFDDIECGANMKVECAKPTIMDMTVRELNAELKARELAVSGNKRDKLYRLLSSLLATRSQQSDDV